MKRIIFSLATVIFVALGIFAQTGDKSIRKASELMMAGDRNGAREILDKNIEKGKALFISYRIRAGIRMSSGDVQGAIADFTSAIELQRNDPTLFETRAFLRMTVSDFQGALSDLDTALSLGSKTENILVSKAFVRERLGDLPGALEDYKVAAAMFPDSPKAILNVASALERLGRLSEAMAVLQPWVDRIELQTNGRLPKAPVQVPDATTVIESNEPARNGAKTQYSLAARSFQVKGEGPEAVTKAVEAVEKKGAMAGVYSSLARLYQKTGAQETALPYIEKSLKIEMFAPALAQRGSIYLELKQYEKAIADLTGAIERAPAMTGIAFADRGLAFLMLGRNVEAQKDFDAYVERFPNSKDKLDERIRAAKAELAQK